MRCSDCVHCVICYPTPDNASEIKNGCPCFKSKENFVEVVRCRDCAYISENGYICHYGIGRATKPEGFCSEGEKREE